MYVFYDKEASGQYARIIELRQDHEIDEAKKAEGIGVTSLPSSPSSGEPQALFYDLVSRTLLYRPVELNITGNEEKTTTAEALQMEHSKSIANLTQEKKFLEQQLFGTETALFETQTELEQVKKEKSFLEQRLFDIETRLLEGGL